MKTYKNNIASYRGRCPTTSTWAINTSQWNTVNIWSSQMMDSLMMKWHWSLVHCLNADPSPPHPPHPWWWSLVHCWNADPSSLPPPHNHLTSIHMISVLRPSSFFVTLLLPCIILNANQGTKTLNPVKTLYRPFHFAIHSWASFWIV